MRFNKMRYLRLITLVNITFLLQACTGLYRPYDNPATDFPKVTAIELRTIQTRKFNKPLNEVAQGIVTNCKDKDGNGRTYTACAWWPYEGYYFNRTLREFEKLSYRVEYELTPDKVSPTSQTIVRMRIYFPKSKSGYRSDEPQVTNAGYYQREFKDLADTLFISAIELTPAEMQ